MNKFILILCIGISSAFSFACSPGVGGGPSGDPHCMAPILANDPYYNGSMKQQSRQPQTIPSKYGAVAINNNIPTSAGVLNMKSLREAKREAIRRCEAGGNAPCKVLGWIRNGCIAIAEGKKGDKWVSYFAGEEQPGVAEKNAVNKCIAANASNCRIFVPEGCSLP